MLQHGAYTMLMDACYDREEFPTIEQAIDWCWASTNEEIEAVNFVLSKFFTRHEGTFKQSQITETLDNYHKNKTTNKAIAIKREADKRTKREQAVNDPTTNEHLITNQELLITNNKLITKDQKKGFAPPSLQEVQVYFEEKGEAPFPARSESEKFIDFYESKGWMVGKNKMKSWKASVRNWMKRGNNNGSHQQNHKPSLAERVTENRKRAEQQIDEQSMGENGTHLRS